MVIKATTQLNECSMNISKRRKFFLSTCTVTLVDWFVAEQLNMLAAVLLLRTPLVACEKDGYLA